MTGVEEGKGSGGGGGGEVTDVSATDKPGQQNGAPEKAPVVAGTNMETLPRPGKQVSSILLKIGIIKQIFMFI